MIRSKSSTCRSVLGWAVVVALSAGLVGCGSNPKPKGGKNLTEEEVLQNEDVKKKPPVVVAEPLDRVHEAALRALTGVGCEVQRNEPYFVAGRRPNKFGLFVGSGGETVKIFLLPSGDKETRVWVDTDLSFVGIAGQQGWDEQVLAGIRDNLAKGKPQ